MSQRGVFGMRLFILIVSVYAIYSHTLSAPFVYDDVTFIVNNQALREPLTLDSVTAATHGQSSRLVGFFTFILNYKLHGLNPFSYRLTNLLIHLVNALLVWWLTLFLLGISTLQTQKLREHKGTVAFLTAMIFAVHPAQTQAISFVSQRIASLATLFYLAALCFYVKARLLKKLRFQTVLWLLGFITAGALGMMTKEIVFTLPVGILLFEMISKEKRRGSTSIQLKIIIMCASACLLLVLPRVFNFNIMDFFNSVRSFLNESIVSRSHAGDVLTAGTYALTQFRVLTTLLKVFFFPVHQNFDYDFPMSTSLVEPITTLTSLLFLCLIIYFAWRIRDRHPLVSIGLAFFFLTISINFIPREFVIAEHKLYLTSVGLCLATATGLFSLIKDFQRFVMTGICIVLILSALTYQRNKMYTSPVALWEDVIQKSPYNKRAYLNLASAYIDQKNFIAAVDACSRLIGINPQTYEAYNSRGLAYQEQGQYPLALDDFNQALIIDPKRDDVYVNRGNLFGLFNQFDEALADYTSAIQLNSDNVPAFNNRGTLWLAKGNYGNALDDLDTALRINPYFVEGHINKGNVYFRQKVYPKALASYNRAIELQPGNVTALGNRASTYMEMGRYDRALNDLDQVLAYQPQSQKFLKRKAGVYQTLIGRNHQ